MLDTIIKAVRDKFKQRAARGFGKYGVTMDRDDLTELEWLEHAQSEMLDGAAYIEKLIQRRNIAAQQLLDAATQMKDALFFECQQKHSMLPDEAGWNDDYHLEVTVSVRELRLFSQAISQAQRA